MSEMELLLLAYGLIAVGILLLAADLFLASGLLFLLAVTAILAGVALSFRSSTTLGVATTAVVFLAVPVVARFLVVWYPRTRMGKRMFLSGPDEDATVASMPVNLELESIRGRVGRTLSDLRPAGVTDFDGRRVDTITEGFMVPAGTWVRCVDVKAGRVIVRPIESPQLDILENTDI
jgi:membrane-bound serine protease (ClpP class)